MQSSLQTSSVSGVSLRLRALSAGAGVVSAGSAKRRPESSGFVRVAVTSAAHSENVLIEWLWFRKAKDGFLSHLQVEEMHLHVVVFELFINNIFLFSKKKNEFSGTDRVQHVTNGLIITVD